jgi:glutamate-1-semialdehyde 2,1-aminomutase
MDDHPETPTIEEYKAKTPGSRSYYDQFCRHLPGGETRSVTHYDPYPVVLTEGHGAVVRDVDGNEYLDVLNNYTVLVHGHGFGPITEAVQAALSTGVVFPAPHLRLLEMAQIMTERYRRAERVRFTNSGTEASLLALRIVRAATGRQRVVIFEGGYHGSIPEFLDGGEQTVRVPYNDTDRAIATIDSSVAAVFAEPFLGSGGVIPGTHEFFRAVQDRAHAVGGLFVLDEVQSLRNAVHGMHSSLGLEPDLLVMGKVIGGGFPVGALGGAASLMNLTNTKRGGRLSHSGSFNGNVATMAAGAASLRALDEPAISVLNRRAESLADQIEAAARRVGIPASVTRAGSILHVHLVEHRPGTTDADKTVPEAWVSELHLALLLEGVYAAPRGMLNLSTALDDEQLTQVAVAYEKAFSRIAALVNANEPMNVAGR